MQTQEHIDRCCEKLLVYSSHIFLLFSSFDKEKKNKFRNKRKDVGKMIVEKINEKDEIQLPTFPHD